MIEFKYTALHYSTVSPVRNPLLYFIWLSLILFISSSLIFPKVTNASETKNVLILPLKVNSPVDTEKYAAMSDGIIGNVTSADGLKTISRSEAQKSFDYNGTWPPSFEKIQSLPFSKNFDYVAVGILTKLGTTFSIDMSLYDLHPKQQNQTGPKNPAVFFYNETDASDTLTDSLEALIEEITAYANRHSLIASITIQGNNKIDTGAILNRVKSKPGDPYKKELLSADLKNIFQMGYFNDIEVAVEESKKGKAITFVVREKEIINKILIEGNEELKEEDIKEVITIQANRIFSTKEMRESIDNMKKLYKEKGYYESKITSALSYPKDGQVEVRFVIEEGPKVYVKDIELLGNSTFSDRKLKKVMVTSEKDLLSFFNESGVLKRDMLEHDTARITAFYHDEGFIEAKVGAAKVRQEKNWLFITFDIAEGQRFGVGKIDLKGDLIEDKEFLLDFIKLQDEKFFSRKTLREDILRLTDFYAEHGFAFAEAFPSIEKNADDNTIDLVIDINKGPLVMVNRIIIQGNTRTRDKVIRREMRIKEGGIFDSGALRRSNQKLQRLDFFEEVNVSPEPTIEENLMDVLVEVKEKPTGNFSIGAGYSSIDKLIFMTEISQNNFLGRGQKLSLSANISAINTRYNLGFTDPHVFDSKFLAGADIYSWYREYDDYDKDSAGFALRFGYPLGWDWYSFWSYSYDHTLLSNYGPNPSDYIKDSLDINYTSAVRLGVQRDTRDKTFGTTKGSRLGLTGKYAGGPLGGDSAFHKIEGNISKFFPLMWTTVFHVKVAAGFVRENKRYGALPVYERFYLGGINTIRGFESGSISPRDPEPYGDKIGGDKMWYSNIEFLFPLVPAAGLRGLIFYDVGNVYNTDSDWDFNNKKHSVGYGFRWLSPMGPLRLEWGYNLDPVGLEEQSSWDFTIGGAF